MAVDRVQGFWSRDDEDHRVTLESWLRLTVE
jgi:hypothetical protein